MNNPVIDTNGNTFYYNSMHRFHNEDGPAIIWASGTKEWCIDGQLHNENGPAYIGSKGTQEWYKYGNRHRIDGPAVIYPDNTKLWYVNRTLYTDNQSYQEAAGISDEEMETIIAKFGNVE